MKRSSCSRLLISFVALTVSAAALHAAPMTRTPTGTITFTYTKKGALPADQTITIKAPTTTEIYFTVDPTTLPDWLTLDKTSGNPTSTVGSALKFGVSAVVASKAVGSYTANVGLTSSSVGVDSPLLIPVTLVVKAAVPILTPSAVTYSAASWKIGDALPTATLTLTSDSAPINFTVAATSISPSSPAWISASPSSGIAYSWGTTVTVTFAPSAFQSATVGSPLTGKLVVTNGGTALPAINLSIAISPPVPTLTGISPTQLPKTITALTTRTIAVKGTNFVHGMAVKLDPDGTGAQSQIAIAEACTGFAAGTSDAWCLQSNQLFFLRLSAVTLAKADPATDQAVLDVVGVTLDVAIETKPIVYSVSDAASFVAPSDELDVSPFEIISIFGENFGTPATGPAAGADGRFPSVLDTDQFKVHFQKASDNSALVGDTDGYLLLWTPTQINLLVPSALPAVAAGGELEMIVTAAGVAGDITTLDVAAATPGVFSFGGGQGQAAAINTDGSLNSSTNPARFGQSQSIVLYMSGLGAVDGGANIGTKVTGVPATAPADCASKASYLARLNVTANPDFNSPDGTVVDITQYVFPPCLDPAAVTLTIGGVDASSNVTYAGWTSGSVAGLYQVNVLLPASSTLVGLSPAASTTAQQYPIVVTVGGVASQSGVYVYLKN